MKRSCLSSTRAVAVAIRLVAGAAAVAATLASAPSALAVCGDVTGDEDVTSTDALAVLKEAVGQNVNLQCQEEPEVDNDVGFANQLECYGYDFNSKMRWSEHSEYVWKAHTEHRLPLDPEYFEVDDLFIGGEIEITLADCGTVDFDLDDWEIAYPMPAIGAVFLYLDYEYDTDTLFLFAHVAPIDTGSGISDGQAASAGKPKGMRMMLGSAPAPKGISKIK